MANRPLHCAECNTLLYLPCPDAGPVDFDNPIRLTVEQMIITEIVCSSTTCPSRVDVQDLFGLMEQPLEQPFEDPDYVLTVDSSMAMGDQGAPLSNDAPPQQQQPPQQQILGEIPEFINGNVVHKGPNPCRRCFTHGSHCRWEEDNDSCIQCRNHKSVVCCSKSLFKAKASGFWKTRCVIDYEPPFSIRSSRIAACSHGCAVLQYHVRWACNAHPAWEDSENLKDFPSVLEAFHLANPTMPGPPDFLVRNENGEFLSEFLAAAPVME